MALAAMRGLRDNVLVWLSTNKFYMPATGVDSSSQLSSPCQSSKMGKTPVRVGTLAFGFCLHFCILQQKHTPGQQNLYSIEHNPQRLKGNHLKAEFLDVIGTKVFRVFLLAIHCDIYQQILLPPFSKSDLKLVCNVDIVFGRKPQV
jgi:hypothetical protein